MYTSILTCALLASTALATNHGEGSSGGGSYGGGPGGSGWEAWGTSSAVVPAAAAASASAAPYSAPPSAPPSGELLVQVVSVGDANGSLKYFPSSIQAPPGSIVQFQFHPKNHTITESSFAAPCIPLAANLTSMSRPGQKSGFVPVTGSETSTPVYNLLVNDTKPIWIYCGQTNHCQKGMAMVINQNLTDTQKTIENYIMGAKQLALVGNGTAPPAGTSVVAPPPAASTSVFAPPPPPPAASSSTLVVVAPPPPPPTSSTSAGLPLPTAAAATTTTGVVAPSTFTGAANPQRVEGKGVMAGLAFVGLAAML